MKRRIVLIIMDGWGLREARDANAVQLAKTPVVDRLWRDYPHTTLDPSGADVGLPTGQMGNSEVGHLNLGAGRVVFQDIMRISNAIADGSFFDNAVLRGALEPVREQGTLHLMGLLSDGGVHSTLDHLYGLIRLAKQNGIPRVRVHAFLDGRDTSPTGGLQYLADLQKVLDSEGVGEVATLTGRYFSMDRDKRWERTQKGYDAIVRSIGKRATDARAALKASYDTGVTDEFVEPIILVDKDDKPAGEIQDGDSVIFFNFRADRARQLTTALTDSRFDAFKRERQPRVRFACMTRYDERFTLPVAFPRQRITNILGEVAAGYGRMGFRIAETEKYAHVTYFFNGGDEVAYPGEDRHMVPSPKVATYDLQPEMSAEKVADALIEALAAEKHDYVVCNFANPDMVGHTGVLSAAVTAVETTDACVGRVIDALDLETDVAIVTADHGNAELMIDPKNGGPHTAHTTNPVPCILVDSKYHGDLITDGSLKEIAPTMCNYMDIPVPDEMTGRDLRENH